jgi:hypothetical protein
MRCWTLELENLNYYGTFLGLVTTDLDALYAGVHLPPNSSGRLVFGNDSDAPYGLVLGPGLPDRKKPLWPYSETREPVGSS